MCRCISVIKQNVFYLCDEVCMAVGGFRSHQKVWHMLLSPAHLTLNSEASGRSEDFTCTYFDFTELYMAV